MASLISCLTLMASLISYLTLMASLIRYPLPYYAPTPMQSAARFERLRQHGRTREHARVAAIERAEPHALRALRGSASAARVVRASFASESATDTGEILFLPQMPDAAQLARRTWAAKFYEAHETEAETSAAAAAVRALRDDPAIVAKVVALWKAPSMQKQLAARFKELTSGGTGRDPAKALNKRFSSRAMQQAPGAHVDDEEAERLQLAADAAAAAHERQVRSSSRSSCRSSSPPLSPPLSP